MSSTISRTPTEFINFASALAGAAGTLVPYALTTQVFDLPFALNTFEPMPHIACALASVAIGTLSAFSFRNWLEREPQEDGVVENVEAEG